MSPAGPRSELAVTGPARPFDEGAAYELWRHQGGGHVFSRIGLPWSPEIGQWATRELFSKATNTPRAAATTP